MKSLFFIPKNCNKIGDLHYYKVEILKSIFKGIKNNINSFNS